MSDTGTIGGEERIPSAPLRLFASLVSGMNATGSCWIVVLMILINVEAIGRSAFNKPIIGVIEMIEISIIGIVFMQLADSLRRGVLTRSDGLFNQLLKKNIVAGYILALITYAIGAIFMGLVIWGSVPYLIDAWKDNYYVGVEGMFTAPVWPIALITVIGVTVTMVQFIIILADYFRLLNPRD